MSDYLTDSQEAPIRRRAWGWVLVSLVLVLAAGVFVAVDVRRYFTVAEVTLPDLVGLPYDQATVMLRREGLEPVTFVEHVAGKPAEVITSQAPDPGSVVKRGRTVHLGVNTPPAQALIPDVVGLLQADALARAAELNLPVGTITFEPSERAAGRVISQSPVGGERLGEGRTLELVVSSGNGTAVHAIPDLTGTNIDDAEVALRALGFRVIERLPSAVSFSEPGTVISTVPPAGEEAATSTPVIVQYSLSTANVVAVPEVVGLPQWQAQIMLRAAQLELGQVTYITDPDRPAGVVEARPTGFTLPGTPVLLTVNGSAPPSLFPDDPVGGRLDDIFGPGRQTPTDPRVTPGGTPSGPGGTTSEPGDGSRQVSFTFDPTNMGIRRLLEESYQLKVVVADDRGERVVVDQRMDPGQTISTTIPVYGQEAMLQTYLDDVFFQAWRP